MDQDSLGPGSRQGQLSTLVPRPWGAKCKLSPSTKRRKEAFILSEDLLSRLAEEFSGCSWHGYSLITSFAFSFTGESGIAGVSWCPGEARASGKFFLRPPPDCSFGILRPIPFICLWTMAGVAPTSKTSFCLPAVLGLSSPRHTWPLANFQDRISETWWAGAGIMLGTR